MSFSVKPKILQGGGPGGHIQIDIVRVEDDPAKYVEVGGHSLVYYTIIGFLLLFARSGKSADRSSKGTDDSGWAVS